jgi:hypothetical protein
MRTHVRKSAKRAPVLIPHFHPLKGVQIKLLDAHSVRNETSGIVADAIESLVHE